MRSWALLYRLYSVWGMRRSAADALFRAVHLRYRSDSASSVAAVGVQGVEAVQGFRHWAGARQFLPDVGPQNPDHVVRDWTGLLRTVRITSVPASVFVFPCGMGFRCVAVEGRRRFWTRRCIWRQAALREAGGRRMYAEARHGLLGDLDLSEGILDLSPNAKRSRKMLAVES